VKRATRRKTITAAQRGTLQYALRLEEEDKSSVFPRRGQHTMFELLAALGYLTYAGRGVDRDDHMVSVLLYQLTDKGRAAAREEQR
jgi:hypothetical protein